MQRYGQFCPVAKACEILGERWTLLILRELLQGATRYNELLRTVGRISPAVLSKRLKTLEAHGLLVRRPARGGRRHEYHLTACGRELEPIVMGFGTWGMRWARGQMTADDLDAELLMVHVCRTLRTGRLPDGGAVLRFRFTDLDDYHTWWILVTDGEADLCVDPPGTEPDVHVVGDLATMTAVWMGDLPLREARSSGRLRLKGLGPLVRSAGAWLGLNMFADVRPAAPGGGPA